MALEQIIADLDDLEERVENLNVDQKTNEDILLNVLKRVDETEKDLRKVRCNYCDIVVRRCVFSNVRILWLTCHLTSPTPHLTSLLEHPYILDTSPFQMKRNTIAKDFEAKQASVAAAGELERAGSEPPLTGTIVGVPSVANADWANVASESFASRDEVGELRQVVALKVR